MFDLKLVHLAAYNSSIVQSYGNVSVKVNKFTRSLCVSSLVIVLLFPKQKAKPKTSAQKTGISMPHCVVRWVLLLRVLRSGGE